MRGFINIFRKGNEENLSSVVLYPNSSDILCKDSDATKKITKDELINLFKKNLILIEDVEGHLARPCELDIDTTFATVKYALITEGDTTTVEYAVYGSDGYTAS